MAIEIPEWLEPVLNFYGIPWPDIDEDAFEHLRQPLRNFGEDLTAVGDTIDSALRLLESGNPSHTLRAITTYFEGIRRDFLSPIMGVCDDLAGWPCTAAYDSIVAVKVGIIALLTYEIVDDVSDVVATIATLGLDSALTAGEAVAVREMVSESLIIAEGEVGSAILSTANQCLDNFVNSLVNPFINGVSNSVQNAVDSYAPQMVLRQALTIEESAYRANDSIAERLHLSPSELDQCVQSINESSIHLDRAGANLVDVVEEIFSHPAVRPQVTNMSPALRMLAKGVVETVERDFVDALHQLIDHVIQHFVTLLQDYKRAVEEIDHDARALASSEHLHLGPEVVVLSAAGLGTVVAADVVRASGVVNGEEAESVEVDTVTVAGDTEAVTVSMRTSAFTTEETATLMDTVEELQLRAPDPTGTFAPATGSGIGVASLQAKEDAVSPHLSSAQGGPETATSPGVQRKDQQVRGIRDASPTPAPSGSAHLRVRHLDDVRPTMARADSAARDVEEVEAKGAAGTPHTDEPPAEQDVD